MRKRLLLSLGVAAVILLFVAVLATLRLPLRRRAVYPARATTVAATGPSLGDLPPEQWTARIIALQSMQRWDELAGELDAIHSKNSPLYDRLHLDYLHARADIEREELDEARARLEPFLRPGSSWRDLALHHRTMIEEADGEDEAATHFRELLISEFPQSIYTPAAIDAHLHHLREQDDPKRMIAFAQKLYPAADSVRRRELDANTMEALFALGRVGEATERGLRLLKAGTTDDAAERVFMALNRPEVIALMTPEAQVLLGETARNHRHFDAAVELLSRARPRLPKRLDELTFAIGRAQFGREDFAAAERTYLQGAAKTKDARAKATLFFHSARAAQLLGDDARAERHLTSAFAVPGRFPATTAALTQRIRTRLHQKRLAEARSDLAQAAKLFGNDRAFLEASLAVATTLIARGTAADHQEALGVLGKIPGGLTNAYDEAEMNYWKARSREESEPASAIKLYLQVMRSPASTHFARFADERLRTPDLARLGVQLMAERRDQVSTLVATKKFEEARRLQTEMVHLSRFARGELDLLRQIYAELSGYREHLTLARRPLPQFPLETTNRDELLMGMGLFDDAVDAIPRLRSDRSAPSLLTEGYAFSMAGALRPSIQAAEILMKLVPTDFVFPLLAPEVRELLYPRYFHQAILDDSEKYDADPQLLLAIMREESRFNPRAKSVAAARGLLQFIITTARQVGRDIGLVDLTSEDLYDPRIIIQLGAKYVGNLMEEFDQNPYRTAAAYNAGPHQTKLWIRMMPASGDDYFSSAVNFDETKHYVRKVMVSYERYGEIGDRR